MRITIENYRGIEYADFTVDGITLVGAPNASGKTSIAQAVQAALNANGLPVPGMTKAMAGFLVRSGATSGFSQVANDNDPDAPTNEITRVEWPKATIHTEGEIPPHASEFASGSASLVDMDTRRLTSTLMEILDAEPKKENLAGAMKKAGIDSEDLVDKLWEAIQDIGWDNQHAQVRDKGAKLKGQWEYISGERYGAKKAEQFYPSNWSQDLETASEDRLQADLVKAKEELESVIAADAVDASVRAGHEARAAGLSDLNKKMGALAKSEASLQSAIDAAYEHLNECPAPPASPETVPCPCCDAELIISGRNKLVAAGEAPDPDEVARQMTAHTDAKDDVNRANAEMNSLLAKKRDLQQEISAAQTSSVWLENNPVQEGKPASEASIDAARERVAEAEGALEAWQQKTQADRIHSNIEKNKAIVDILAPKGLRQSVLNSKTREFVESHIKPLADVAKWQEVAFDRDLTITYGGRIYGLLSESEKFRTRVLLQLALAKKEGAPLVVVDAADILDKGGRAGFFRMLHGSGQRCLVCMTYGSKENLPPIGKLKNSQTVWINNGRTEFVE